VHQIAEEGEPPGFVQGDQPREEQPPEQLGENPHQQQEGRTCGDLATTIAREAAAGHDHVDVGVVGHGRAPGVGHGGQADAGTEVLGVGGDRQHRLGGRPEQQVVDGRLVLEGDVGDLRRQGEHDVEVADRQQVGLARGQPRAGRRALAFGAVPVAAGVVGDDYVGSRDGPPPLWWRPREVPVP